MVEFSDVSAGTYRTYVERKDFGFARPNSSNDNKIIVALVASTAGTTSSYAGGNTLKITGFGFTAKTVVKVCGKTCKITKSSHSSVECNTPKIVSAKT